MSWLSILHEGLAGLHWRRLAIGSVVGLILLLGPVMLPAGLLPAVVGAGVYVPAVFGLVLLTGRTGQLSLGHGPLVGLGAYAYVVASEQGGLPPLLAAAIAIAITSAVALLTSPILRLSGLTFALATLAVGFILTQLFTNLASLTGGPSGITNAGVRPDFFGIGQFSATTLDARYYLILAAGTLALVCCWNLLRSRVGQALDFIATDEHAAHTLGIDVQATKVRVWVLASALAGLSGVLHVAFSRFAAPDQFGVHLSALLVAAVVVGGIRSLLGGAAVLVLFFTAVELTPALDASAALLTGLVIVVVVVARELGRFPWHRARPSSIDITDLAVDANRADVTDLAADADQADVTAAATVNGARLCAVAISVTFGGVHAVRDVSLTVTPGRIIGLIGPNGAGKTTLINALTGMVAADSGRVRLDDLDITEATAVQRVHLGIRRTHQNIRVVPTLTVRQNVELGGHSLGRTGFTGAMLALPRELRERRRIADAAAVQLQRWGLRGLADATAGTLPAGSRRLLEVARACVTAPRVLFLDEPAAGLNDVETDRLAVLIRETAAAGTSVLLVEHDLPLVMDLCQEVVVLDQGAVVATGTPAEILANPVVHEIYIGPSHAES